MFSSRSRGFIPLLYRAVLCCATSFWLANNAISATNLNIIISTSNIENLKNGRDTQGETLVAHVLILDFGLETAEKFLSFAAKIYPETMNFFLPLHFN